MTRSRLRGPPSPRTASSGTRRGARLAAVLCALAAVSPWACGSADDGVEARAVGGTPSGAGADTVPGGELPEPGMAWVIFGHDTVRAEVAEAEEERERGLMHRRRLEEGRGMLFVFPRERVRSFWMKNTYIALDIAFLDSTLEVVDVQQMEPETEDFYESTAPAMFALEVPQGWLEARGVRVGTQAEIVFGPR